MASPLANATEATEKDFAGFQPESAADMIDFFADMPKFWEALAGSLGTLGSRMADEMPLHPGLAEQVNEMAGAAAGLRDQAEEMHKQFRAVHEKEIRRIEQPRPGEQAWDVSN
jgi:hypothetical protein